MEYKRPEISQRSYQSIPVEEEEEGEFHRPIEVPERCDERIPPPAAPNAESGSGSDNKLWEIWESVVYGGLKESITSLGILICAASSGIATGSSIVLTLAYTLGRLFINASRHGEFKHAQSRVHNPNDTFEEVDRYQVLARKQNLQAAAALISSLVCGVAPPVAYGYMSSWRIGDVLKHTPGAAVPILLVIGRACIHKPHFRTLAYYCFCGLIVSGGSYVGGRYGSKLLMGKFG